MIASNKLKKSLDTHLKVLKNKNFKLDDNIDNHMQFLIKNNKLITMSRGSYVTLILGEEYNANDSEVNIVNPENLSKTLSHMGESVSIRLNEKDVDFYNDNSQVKLHKLNMQDDYKVSVGEYETALTEVKDNGIQLDKGLFFNTIRRLITASGEVEDVELYNVVNLNFNKKGEAFSGETTSFFMTNFGLEDKELVIEKGVANLILNMDTEDDTFYIDVKDDKTVYSCGNNLLIVEKVIPLTLNAENFKLENLNTDIKLEFDINTFTRLVRLSNTLSEDNSIEVAVKDGEGTIKSGVYGNDTDFSKGEFTANDDLDISFVIDSEPLINILNVIESDIDVYVDEDRELLAIDTKDKTDFAIIKISLD